jgi:hypothetical protein
VVPSNAGGLECVLRSFADTQFPVPLVEVAGSEIGDWQVTEFREDDRVRRPSGVVEGSRRQTSGLAVAEPFVDEVSYVQTGLSAGSASFSSSCQWRN